MAYADTDGVKLYYESSGRGDAILFIHEFAGDCRSWEPQVRHFSRRYRCITYNARGYPPSDVPTRAAQYSQAIAADDAAAVLRHLGIKKAHIVGLSMGGFATVHFGLRHPRLARSLVIGGCGYGSEPEGRAQFQADAKIMAREFREQPMADIVKAYSNTAYRKTFKRKDRRGWAEFSRMLADHSPLGSALTMERVQARRPSLRTLEAKLARLNVPAFIVSGDEDEPCLEPSLRLKRVMPRAGLWLVPRTGHTVNLEEPVAYNAALDAFFAAVETGGWPKKDNPAIAFTESALRPNRSAIRALERR